MVKIERDLEMLLQADFHAAKKKWLNSKHSLQRNLLQVHPSTAGRREEPPSIAALHSSDVSIS